MCNDRTIRRDHFRTQQTAGINRASFYQAVYRLYCCIVAKSGRVITEYKSCTNRGKDSGDGFISSIGERMEYEGVCRNDLTDHYYRTGVLGTVGSTIWVGASSSSHIDPHPLSSYRRLFSGNYWGGITNMDTTTIMGSRCTWG